MKPSTGTVVGAFGAAMLFLVAVKLGIFAYLNRKDVDAPTHAMAIRAVEGCPAAVEALGTPVSRVDMPGGEKNATHSSWTFTVEGPRGKALLSYDAKLHVDRWILTRADLSVGGRGLDLLACPK